MITQPQRFNIGQNQEHGQLEDANRQLPRGESVDRRQITTRDTVHSLIPEAATGPTMREHLHQIEAQSPREFARLSVPREQQPSRETSPVVPNFQYHERRYPNVQAVPSDESALEGMSKSAMGVGSTVINTGYGLTAAGTLALGSLTAVEMATMLGIPAATGAIGAYVGSKYGHPILGANIGVAAGATALATSAPMIGLLASGALSTEFAIGGGLIGATAIGTGALMGVAVPCAAGAGLYGLGRLTSKALGVRKGGVMKNLALGAATVGTAGLLPLGGYLYRKWSGW